MINLATILQLTRPLTVFDLETTGGNPDTDRIWQISITRHRPKKDPKRWTRFVNPQMPIPPELIEKMKIHPEKLEKIAQAYPFSYYGPELAKDVMVDTDYAGHNILFDLRVIRREFQRLEIDWDWTKTDARTVCTLRIYQILFPRDLQAAYKEFVDPKGFEGAHDAGVDVRSTEEVLKGQLTRYPEIPRTIPELADYCFPKDVMWVDREGKFVWRHNEACIGFGKYAGTTLKSMVKKDAQYLDWMLKKDFPEDTKELIRKALKGEFPQR